MGEFKAVTATHKLLKLDKRIRAAAGGTSASKTISILLILIDKAIVHANQNKPLLISIVSESLPHLKRGVMRDFLNIMESHGYFQKYGEIAWNRTDFIFTFGPGCKIEFFGVDTPDKVRGPRRDILFMNEANNCPYESFEQLEVRTKQEIWLDWNPTNEFWFYTEILNNPNVDYVKNNVDFITLTYKDNESLNQEIVQSIEAKKHNTEWWKVYGLGQLGEVEGKIYKGWKFIDEIPHEARLERLGLDFGFANDPAVLVATYYYNGSYIVDELLFQTQMSNRRIADYIINSEYKNILTIADSAEPKSVSEMQEYGINIIGAIKGPGSVYAGIQWVQDQKVSVTKKSLNIIKAYRNYMWKTDRLTGKIVGSETGGKPSPNHMYSDAMDAIRYAMESLRPEDDEDEEPVSGNLSKLYLR
jgi:phage terminase large subunit